MIDKKHPEVQYLELMQDILDNGVKQEDMGTNAITYSVFGRQLRFDLSEGFPLLTTKKTFWKGILYELAWFIKGDNNIKYLLDNGIHIWDDYPYKIYREKMEKGEEPELSKKEFIEKISTDEEYSKKWGELKYVYGEQWRAWPTKDGNTVDQLQWVIDELKKDPDAHNTLVNAWNPEYLYEMARPEKACRFPICHNMYQLNIKDGKLSLLLYQRSADIFLGVPFNIASYALLTIILAKIIGVEPGEFIHNFGDVHIYGNHIDQVKMQLEREPYKFSTVKIEGELNNIDDFKPEMVKLENYESHPMIKGELSPTGGLKTKTWENYTKKKSN